ncbi:MAG: alpha-amylase family glycosyl hydrolase [Chloroflexota bacterium]
MAWYEFHISRNARDRHQLDDGLFATNGQLVVADFAAARQLAERMSAGRSQPVPASDVYAMGLIDEILHILVRQYEMQNPGVMTKALGWLKARLGAASLDTVLLRFTEQFPPLTVYRGRMSPLEYFESTGGAQEMTTEEALLLHLSNANPAFGPYKELFDDSDLARTTAYPGLVSGLQDFFAGQPDFDGHGGESLFDVLRAPARVSPNSLSGQLEYILQRWAPLLGEEFVQRLLRSLDFVREEATRRGGTGGFGGEAPVLEFPAGLSVTEYERFSEDKDWMPRAVLMARNTYVWLEQLSRKYGRWIRHLDEIPDEELDLLAQRGFTGLWLIGLWERSQASQWIKQRMGDHEAVASAYSLYAYDIAADLGGWPALENLRWRAWQRGLRLSADMVPNHMGIDSKWLIEHPDWFLSLPYSPYPNYQFQSEDLCADERVAVILEDHYYSHSDAAVVFKRIDRYTGDVRYIYHGNDGTSMPWNDTAQLDYSKAEVREAVIQTILHVARNFPIIRFDAAMTLAKKHIQRLWFPEPGAGGAIPSRSEHGMSITDFEAAIPHEFWREVVDRVAAEVPDTLLLAEAFWLMEGYFVRTLGMHRVYNSAFMHMLRDEDNAKYRSVMKNVLEFDPQVLKRFVNFMNNPDEKTAAEQFGTTDKYFGVATLLSTLPGLPMFGHGQIEGFREKYGMEFRKPKWDESVDEGLVRGHEYRIFPLLHRRRLFAEVENFLLYDFFTTDGYVNEDVFAYSNGYGSGSGSGSGNGWGSGYGAEKRMEERGLVVYHNKYAATSGWVKTSAAFMDKGSGHLVQKTLGEGLALPREGYAIFKDYVAGLEYIRPCSELWEKGIYAELGAYQCQVFLDWRFVEGSDWELVNSNLNGAGVESVQAKWEEMMGTKDESGKMKGEKKGRGASPLVPPNAGRKTKKGALEKPIKKKGATNKQGT